MYDRGKMMTAAGRTSGPAWISLTAMRLATIREVTKRAVMAGSHRDRPFADSFIIHSLEKQVRFIFEKSTHAGCSKMPGCKAPEILSRESYPFVRRVAKDEGNAADGRFSTA